MKLDSVIIKNEKVQEVINWCEQHLDYDDYDWQVIRMMPMIVKFTFKRPIDLTATLLHN